eukprot:gene5231-3745_t
MLRSWRCLRQQGFVDSVKVLLASGAGGDGVSVMAHEHGNEFAGPGGGNGGNGGSVFARCVSKVSDLRHIQEMGNQLAAGPGCCGYSRQAHGRRGEDLWLSLPVGCQITDVDTNEVLFDLDEPGTEVLLLEGGQGGKGNAAFANRWMHSPVQSTRGLPGNTLLAQIELKIIADCGLIGYPNAGKSSLLAALTSSKPAVAPYPFTTLRPYVGVLRNVVGDVCRIADLPGLIEGAYENRGLGHQFLRHVERSKTLAYVVDMSESYHPVDEPPLQPWEVVERLGSELEYYAPGLSRRSIMVFANKMDIERDPQGCRTVDKLEELRRRLPQIPVFPVSAALGMALGGTNSCHTGLAPAVEYLTKHVFQMNRSEELRRARSKRDNREELEKVFRLKHNGVFIKEHTGEASDHQGSQSLVDQQLDGRGDAGYDAGDGYEHSIARRQLHQYRDWTMKADALIPLLHPMAEETYHPRSPYSPVVPLMSASIVVTLKECLAFLKAIADCDTLSMFAAPVNPEEVPGYNEVIRRPMDLTTIREKVEKGKYTMDSDVEDDVALMIANALDFNSSESELYALAKEMRRKYHKLAVSSGMQLDEDAAYIPSKRFRDDETTLRHAEKKGTEKIEEVMDGLRKEREIPLEELRQKYQRRLDTAPPSEESEEEEEEEEEEEDSETDSSEGESETDSSEEDSESDSSVRARVAHCSFLTLALTSATQQLKFTCILSELSLSIIYHIPMRRPAPELPFLFDPLLQRKPLRNKTTTTIFVSLLLFYCFSKANSDRVFLAPLLLVAFFVCLAAASSSGLPYAPVYHLYAPGRWMGPPSAPVRHPDTGKIDVFAASGADPGAPASHVWLHLASVDYVRWFRDVDVEAEALLPASRWYNTGGSMAGSAVLLDDHRTAAVAYTCIGSGGETRVCIGTVAGLPSGGATVQQSPVNPVLHADSALPAVSVLHGEFRDPASWWGPGGRWTVGVAAATADGAAVVQFSSDQPAQQRPFRLDGDRSRPPTFVDLGAFEASKSFWDPVTRTQRVLGYLPEDPASEARQQGWAGALSCVRVARYVAAEDRVAFRPAPELRALRLEKIFAGSNLVLEPNRAEGDDEGELIVLPIQVASPATAHHEIMVELDLPPGWMTRAADRPAEVGLLIRADPERQAFTKVGMQMPTQALCEAAGGVGDGVRFRSVPLYNEFNGTDVQRCNEMCEENTICDRWDAVLRPYGMDCNMYTLSSSRHSGEVCGTQSGCPLGEPLLMMDRKLSGSMGNTSTLRGRAALRPSGVTSYGGKSGATPTGMAGCCPPPGVDHCGNRLGRRRRSCGGVYVPLAGEAFRRKRFEILLIILLRRIRLVRSSSRPPCSSYIFRISHTMAKNTSGSRLSLSYLLLLGLSLTALLFEAPTTVYLWANDRSVQSIITSSWVTYHVGEASNGMSLMYIFVLVCVALPRLCVLYLPNLRVMVLYAAVLQMVGAIYHITLLNHVWMASTYDIVYIGSMTGLSLVLLVRFLSLTSEAVTASRVSLEKRAADLQRIRAMRAAYEENRRAAAKAAVSGPNSEGATPQAAAESAPNATVVGDNRAPGLPNNPLPPVGTLAPDGPVTVLGPLCASRPSSLAPLPLRCFFFSQALQSRATLFMSAPAPPSLTQWYTAAVLSVDAFTLFLLWTQPPRQLSQTIWFEKRNDDSLGATLFTLVMLLIMSSAVLALFNGMNRWVLLHHCGVETLRLVLFTMLMNRMEKPQTINTVCLVLMGINIVIHLRNWYSVWNQLYLNALEKKR